MTRTAAVYARLDDTVEGPLSAIELRQMAEAGRVLPRTLVSVDGRRWVEAERIRGLFPSPVAPDAAASAVPKDELRDLVFRVQGCLGRLDSGFRAAVGATVIGALFGGFTLLYAVLSFLAPQTPHLFLAAVGLLPAALLAAAAGQLAGAAALRRFTGLSEDERRWLAIHLPWSRVPSRWPAFLRNWIYGRDWLVEGPESLDTPYVRAFVTGRTPPDAAEELVLWRQLVPTGPNGLVVGHGAWEMSWMERLPAWTRELERGTTLTDLERRIGPVARAWALQLLHRAASRMPEFVPADFRSDTGLASFEFHPAQLSGGREGLLVVLHPRHIETASSQLVGAATA